MQNNQTSNSIQVVETVKNVGGGVGENDRGYHIELFARQAQILKRRLKKTLKPEG